MIRINLLIGGPVAQRRAQLRLRSAFLTAFWLSLVGYGAYLYGQRATLLARANAAETQVLEYTALASRADAVGKRKSELAIERDNINRVLADRRTSAELFEAIGRSLTDDLWLTEIKRSALNIQIDGLASSVGAIAAMVHNLSLGHSFTRPPAIRSVSAEGSDRPQRFRFEVIGELAVPREARP